MPAIIFRPQKCNPPSSAPHYFDRLPLRPGTNLVDDSDMAALEAHPDWLRYLTWGAIEVVAEAPVILLEPPPPSLAAYSVEAVEPIIEQCPDLPTLEGWLTGETRKAVRQLLNRRINALKTGQEA